MKTMLHATLLLLALANAPAASTINSVNRHAYAANLGWVDCRADATNGAVIGDYVCSGYIYSANVGWISLGDGTPEDGIRYANNSAADCGVNHDGFGHLSGYAYGANIGWIQFATGGKPTVDLKTGKLSGYAYSANCGWISLSNQTAFVQTDTIVPGPLSGSGLPLAWELENFQDKNIDANGDPDGDSQTNAQEYWAGTDPNNPGSALQIVGFGVDQKAGKTSITWTSVSNRCYRVMGSESLNVPVWVDSGLGEVTPDGPLTGRSFSAPGQPQYFFLVQAIKPLAP